MTTVRHVIARRRASWFAVAIATAVIAIPAPATADVTDAAICPRSPPVCTASRTNCCTRDFPATTSAKAILIPIDRCHQPGSSSNGPNSTNGSSPSWCFNSPSSNANSMDYSYGLVYRLMQQGINVYWVVNPTKAPTTVAPYSGGDIETTLDIDLWVLGSGANPPPPGTSLSTLSGTSPIQKLKDDGTTAHNLVVDSTWGSSGSYQKNEFPVRGGAFLIAPADVPAFKTAWAKRPTGRTGCGATASANCYDFTNVQLYQIDASAHVAWQDFTQSKVNGEYVRYDNQLPVAMKIDYPPPRVAEIGSQGLANWLSSANLNDLAAAGCENGQSFSPSDAVGCSVSESDVLSDKLITAGFTWAWVNINSTSCTTVGKLRTFLTAIKDTYTAGNVMLSNNAIAMAEGCTTDTGGKGLLGGSAGLAYSNSSMNESASAPIIVHYPSHLFAQFGDLPLNFASGTVTYWSRVNATTGANLYDPAFSATPSFLHRLMTQEGPASSGNPLCTNHNDLGTVGATSPATCNDAASGAVGAGGTTADVNDLFAYGRYMNQRANGILYYSPGNNVDQNPQQAQLRMILSALVATPPLTVYEVITRAEITRAAPVPATINGTKALVQGSYEYSYITLYGKDYAVPRAIPGLFTHDDIGIFTFPVQRGHMRAIATSAFDASATSLNKQTALFDAASAIPTATFTGCTTLFRGACRTLFTSNRTGVAPANVMIDESHVSTTIYKTDGTASTLGAVLAPSLIGDTSQSALVADQKVLIDRILAGYDINGDGSLYISALGGVDRSTVAVIGPGIVPGRPTVAYFGASDGMLHAVCANTVAPCDVLGRELWAYIPRVNLPNLRYNNARVDGSPRVIDMYGDWTNTGNKTWKTVLTFHTGGGEPGSVIDAGPAVYALDITDPTAPAVLWEYATPTTRGSYELGVGLTLAAGAVTIQGADANVVIAATNNGGTGGNGIVVTALQAETGTPLWQFASPYPAVRVPGNVALPSTGVPGGAVSVDKTKGGNGYMTDLVVADLYGSLWLLDPVTGASRYTSSGTYYRNGQIATGSPLFRFSTDYHPIGGKPAIYRLDTAYYAAFTDGGYVDVSGNTGWGTNTTQHYAVAVSLDAASNQVPLDENKGAPNVPVKIALGSGERGYSQVTVVGSQLFFTTDSATVNAAAYGTGALTGTGHAYSYDLASATSGTTLVLANGASSIASSGTNLYASSGSSHQQLSTPALSSIGAAVTATTYTNLVRQLWLRSQ
jgi:hypothetical protein